MQLTVTEIGDRMQAIRLPLKKLALRAGLDESSLSAVLARRVKPRAKTLALLDWGLRQEEEALFRHLAPLFQEQAAQEQAAAIRLFIDPILGEATP